MHTTTPPSNAIELETRPGVRTGYVDLQPLSAPTAMVAAGWLAQPTVNRWLDFGSGRQALSGLALLSMDRSGKHAIRIVHDEAGEAFGIIALSHLDSPFRSAWLWAARDPARKRAPLHVWLSVMLRYGFNELGLRSVYTQIVESNAPSIVSVQRAGMRAMGRQRLAHVIDGQFYVRILFDITDLDFREIEARSASDSPSSRNEAGVGVNREHDSRQ